MFGLMKYKHAQAKQPYAYRQFYCGMCKTMGKSFGQRSRMLLNHDAVFLGELLNNISEQEQAIYSFSRAYESFNCFKLPETHEMPKSLQYAGAANVLFGSLSAKDHIDDNTSLKRMGWQAVDQALKSAVHRANPLLEQASLPLHEIEGWIKEQSHREAAHQYFDTFELASDYYAEPTARITGLVFQHGTGAVGRSDLADDFYEFGYQFGQLIYLLDAYEDFEKDQEVNAFNGLKKAAVLTGKSLDKVSSTRKLLREKVVGVKVRLQGLPIAETFKAVALARLERNTNSILGIRQACCTNHTMKCSPRMTMKEKWETVNQLSRRILEKGSVLKDTWWGRINRKTSHYTLAVTMMAIPEQQIRQLAENPEVAESYTNFAYLPLIGAATIGLMAAMPYLSSAMSKTPVETTRKPNDCWSDCIADCVVSCCTSCCEACCDSLCSGESDVPDDTSDEELDEDC